MKNQAILPESPELLKYVKRMEGEVNEVIKLSHSFPQSFDIGDPNLRRSLHLEAVALACFWIESFSEATPEMLIWAKLFSKRLVANSEIVDAYTQIGFPGEAKNFLGNRLAYYKNNKASWQLNEEIVVSWIGIVNFCALFRDMKAPPMIGKNQDANHLLVQREKDLANLQKTLGIDPSSQEYIDLMGVWLKGYAESLARTVSGSTKAYVTAIEESKRGDLKAVKIARLYKCTLLALSCWCVVLSFCDFDKIWIYQLTRIGVTAAAVFLAIILRGWQMFAAILIAVLFNPIAPIDFDNSAWTVVDLSAGMVFLILAFWPSPHSVGKNSTSL
ncbi:DUF6804 family protein [Luteolibacter sp. Populi]|uniref:DUF6804 family protein n=1 Tax=Luteolibacter sp. Populi TaxID=3230487 RepID=UPI003467725C